MEGNSWGGATPFLTRNCMQRSSKPFASYPAPPKQPPLPSAIFTLESGGKGQTKVKQQYQQ
eukprot:7301833-Ditylum_brightwellii.AAC.1